MYSLQYYLTDSKLKFVFVLFCRRLIYWSTLSIHTTPVQLSCWKQIANVAWRYVAFHKNSNIIMMTVNFVVLFKVLWGYTDILHISMNMMKIKIGGFNMGCSGERCTRVSTTTSTSRISVSYPLSTFF